jgi:hypothetical protein
MNPETTMSTPLNSVAHGRLRSILSHLLTVLLTTAMAIAVFKLPPLKNVGFLQTSWEFL